MMSSSRITRYSVPSIFTVVPEYLPNRIRSPTLTSSGLALALVVALAGADGDHLALVRLLGDVVGDNDPAGALAFLFEPLDDHAIMQGTDFHHVFLQLHRVCDHSPTWGWPEIPTDRVLLALDPGEC